MNPYPIIPMLSGLAMESLSSWVGTLLFFGLTRLVGRVLIEVDDRACNVRTELVPGVVRGPALILVLRGEHHEDNRTFLEVQQARIGPGFVDRPGLVGDGHPLRQEARKLVLVVALLEVL